MAKTTLAVILGNRGFFPDQLILEARKDLAELLVEFDLEAVMLGEHDTKYGSVETWEHARQCAELFKLHRDRIEGVLVVLPNFGDEKAIADVIRLAGLRVPILVQAYPDSGGAMRIDRRRDSFCGKISACSNLRQYNIPFSVTSLHTSALLSASFKADLKQFIGVCKVVNGLRGARLGAIGARPNAFNTVRYSEKLLEVSGISVMTADLSEILGAANRLKDEDALVKERLESIRAYVPTDGVPSPALQRMARFGVALTNWMKAQDVCATAIQCWDSIQLNYGVNVCTLMSMLSEELLPSACETDVTGVVSMYALQLATGTPAALVDWNNNYEEDPDKCVLFHCGNWAKSFFAPVRAQGALQASDTQMVYNAILAGTYGQDNTYGPIAGRVPAGPMSYARVATDDACGKMRTYVGDAAFTDDPLDSFGALAVVEVPALQKLLKHIVMNGFEHHVAMAAAPSAEILAEAFGTYMGWEVYRHA